MRRLLGLLGRLIGLALAVVAGLAVWRALHPAAAEEIPPARPMVRRPDPVDPAAAAGATGSTAEPVPAPSAAWVPPVDGECPPGYPIKAKHSSEVFHAPGGASYDRTRPDRCYRDAAAAEADGLRAAKR
ncbi:MAG: hypothetical protein ACKO72_09130 [Actinomycetes bacterium]